MFKLEEIIDSKYEPEILSFLLLAPPRFFYPGEIAQRLAIPKVKVDEILNKMWENGQLKKNQKKNIVYFALKDSFKPFPELKNALLKDKLNYEDELFEAIEKLPGITACYLSGIFCGNSTLPVDILFIGKSSDQLNQKFLPSVEKLMGQEINYSVLTEDEFLVRRNTFDRFIKDVFDYPHIVVFEKFKNNKLKRE